MERSTSTYGMEHLYIWKGVPVHMEWSTCTYGREYQYICKEVPVHIKTEYQSKLRQLKQKMCNKDMDPSKHH